MSKEILHYDLIVIGGGAAGFFCAINAAEQNPSLKIAIIEKTSKLLSKVKVSGGGRCNLTHGGLELEELSQQYPRGQKFLRKAFHHFSPKDTIEWFQSRGVPLKIEKDGRMFPQSNNSETIVDCLIQKANTNHVAIYMNAALDKIYKSEDYWSVEVQDGRIWYAKHICVTCGGFSKPSHYEWLSKLGLEIVTPVPSLFTFNIKDSYLNALMGVSVSTATIKILGSKLASSGPILITHWGLSGPAVLKLSAIGARILSDGQYDFSVMVNWLSNYNEDQLRHDWNNIRNKNGNKEMGGANPFGLPARLWSYFLEKSKIGHKTRWSDLKNIEQNSLIKYLTTDIYQVKGKTTFKEEFVTCGGILLNNIDVNTMQAKKLKGLYFAGEVLDIDGITGGYNFQNAWTTAWIAAKNIANA